MRAERFFANLHLPDTARRPPGKEEPLNDGKSLSMPGAKNGFATSSPLPKSLQHLNLLPRDFSPADRQLWRVKNRVGNANVASPYPLFDILVAPLRTAR